jgi:FtsH-binding integral membrane protein
VIVGVVPPAEHVHWMFAGGVLLVGLCLLAEAIVGEEVWNRRTWRRYLWPSLMFLLGLFMWPVMTFFTNSAAHMLAHGSWAQALMFGGAAQLGLASGKLHSHYWRLTVPLALVVSGAAFLLHEQNGWFYSRSTFIHHVCGWTLIVGAIFPFALTFRPRSVPLGVGYAFTLILIAFVLFTARDVAPILGHLSPEAGAPHR